MKRLTMVNGEVRDAEPQTADDHPSHHRTQHRPGRGLFCHDCERYVTTYDP